jgi:hypothetical protein
MKLAAQSLDENPIEELMPYCKRIGTRKSLPEDIVDKRVPRLSFCSQDFQQSGLFLRQSKFEPSANRYFPRRMNSKTGLLLVGLNRRNQSTMTINLVLSGLGILCLTKY